jgi:hypothetical protein
MAVPFTPLLSSYDLLLIEPFHTIDSNLDSVAFCVIQLELSISIHKIGHLFLSLQIFHKRV